MAEVTAKLNKDVFGLEVTNHELLGRAYRAYLAGGRTAAAVAKKRGEVSGGGRKPWQQKGTGRARIGSNRAPHWRGGGVTFGPTGDQNYTITIPKSAKKIAIRQALSIQNKEGIVKTFESYKPKDGKTKDALSFIKAQKAENISRILMVVGSKNEKVIRSVANLQNIKCIAASYLNVYDVMNADLILISKDSLSIIETWLLTPASKAGTDKARTKVTTLKAEPKATKTNKPAVTPANKLAKEETK
jgi:large subunit ribosomal protein L4